MCLLRFFTLNDSLDNQEKRKSINNAYKAQIEKKDQWTFFDERLHMETLFSQRVNFILLIFPILVTTYVRVDNILSRIIISFIGLILLVIFYIPLIKTFFKLDTLQKITYKIEMGDTTDNNPIAFANQQLKQQFEKKEEGQDENLSEKNTTIKNLQRKLVKNSSYPLIMAGIGVMIILMAALFVLAICMMLS